MAAIANIAKTSATQFVVFAKPRWATFVKYGKIEMMPPSPAELPEAFARAGKVVKSATTMSWRKLTVKEAWLNTLVACEVLGWFFVGECIGKRGLVGYTV